MPRESRSAHTARVAREAGSAPVVCRPCYRCRCHTSSLTPDPREPGRWRWTCGVCADAILAEKERDR